MTSEKTLDPRYRMNIELGMRVMIKEENSKNSELIPCYVKKIITQDVMNESGIKVVCEKCMEEDSKIGRVKHIGTESTFMTSLELILNLEKRLRDLIVEELSQDDLNWWENIIDEKIKNDVDFKVKSGKEERERLQIPEYPEIQELFFKNLLEIIISKGPWKRYFEKVFGDKNAVLVKLTELSPYRNLPAHGKEPTPHIEKKIQVYYDDLVHSIESYQRSSSK